MTKLTCTLSIACESGLSTVNFFPGFAGHAPPCAESALTTAAQGWPHHISLPACHMFIPSKGDWFGLPSDPHQQQLQDVDRCIDISVPHHADTFCVVAQPYSVVPLMSAFVGLCRQSMYLPPSHAQYMQGNC